MRHPRWAVEFELKVDFGQVNPMRHEDDVSAPHTVTSRDLKLDNDCATPAHFFLSQEEQDERQAGGIAICENWTRSAFEAQDSCSYGDLFQGTCQMVSSRCRDASILARRYYNL